MLTLCRLHNCFCLLLTNKCQLGISDVWLRVGKQIVDRGLLNPYFMKIPLYYLSSFSNFVQPHFPLSFYCLVSFAECVVMPDLMCNFASWNYGLKLVKPCYLSTGSTLAVHFMQQGIKFTEGLTRMACFACTLIWYHKHRETQTEHTGINRLSHMYK